MRSHIAVPLIVASALLGSLPDRAMGEQAVGAPADTSHAGHHPAEAPASEAQHDHGMEMPQHPPQHAGQMGAMAGVLGIPMDRIGSGTSWTPDAVTLPSLHWMAGAWSLMAHGAGYLQYNHQGGPRGDDQLGSLNWAMLMAHRAVGSGQLQLRGMLSLEPITVTDRGYPLLLQTGELYEGEPIRDRQHPHDFVMELAALYERPIGPLGLSVYAAAAGEPALGPVAFMHRPSAMDDPLAPLAHHWLDATHVTFGVATVGVFSRRWKLEGSVFNGREPDEDRWDFDFARMDSYSARLTLNPHASWSLSAGAGILRSPEALHPGEDIRRVAAAVMHGRRLARGQWASTLAWGANTNVDEGGTTHGVVLETEAVVDRNTLFARIDFAQKSAEELRVEDEGGFDHERLFGVGAASLGYVRDIGSWLGLDGGVGVRGTVSLVPDELESFYGSRTPLSGVVFFRVRPSWPAPVGGGEHVASAR